MKYEPKADCKFCKGTGINKKERPCICRFVDHSVCEEIGDSLSAFAKKELAAMQSEESMGEHATEGKDG